METKKVNVTLPKTLYNDSKKMIEKGIFSNFSDVVRSGLREELLKYGLYGNALTEKDKQVLKMIANNPKIWKTEKELAELGINV
jgi:Arc/MetJ-type ribon-helix-helix transcriptional regulator